MPVPVYEDQSAAALIFQLISGAVDTTQFTIVKEGNLEVGGAHVRAGIIGASHFLTLTLPSGEVLNEVFACTHVHTESPRVIAGPLGSLMATTTSRVHGGSVVHAFTPRLVVWGEGARELSELHELIRRAKRGDEIGLSFKFPSKDGDDRPPLTLVWVYGRNPGRITVKTAHCYPNEGSIVFTKSVFNYHC